MSETKKRKIKTVDDIKINVIYTEGYQRRFTMACINALKRQEEQKRLGMQHNFETAE